MKNETIEQIENNNHISKNKDENDFFNYLNPELAIRLDSEMLIESLKILYNLDIKEVNFISGSLYKRILSNKIISVLDKVKTPFYLFIESNLLKVVISEPKLKEDRMLKIKINYIDEHSECLTKNLITDLTELDILIKEIIKYT